ncbi:MAG: hypothetical protein ABR543_01600 [Gemmatimonadaceae bacterium]
MSSILKDVFPAPLHIRVHAPLLAPILMIVSLHTAALLAARPLLHQADPAPAAKTLFWIMLVVSPLASVIKDVVLGVMAWAVGTLSGAETARLRPFISVVLYADVVLALSGVSLVASLHLRGARGITESQDLVVPQGIDMFADISSPVWAAVAQSTTLYHVLWFVVLVATLPGVAALSRSRAAIVAGALWGTVITVGVLRGILLS